MHECRAESNLGTRPKNLCHYVKLIKTSSSDEQNPILYQFLSKQWKYFRCRAPCIIRASNWLLTVGQGLLSLQQGMVEGQCFYFLCFFTFIHFPVSPLSRSFTSSIISSISCLPLSGRLHKMTNKGWRVVKPQHNQSILLIYSNILTSEFFHFVPIIRRVGCLQTFYVVCLILSSGLPIKTDAVTSRINTVYWFPR